MELQVRHNSSHTRKPFIDQSSCCRSTHRCLSAAIRQATGATTSCFPSSRSEVCRPGPYPVHHPVSTSGHHHHHRRLAGCRIPSHRRRRRKIVHLQNSVDRPRILMIVSSEANPRAKIYALLTTGTTTLIIASTSAFDR